MNLAVTANDDRAIEFSLQDFCCFSVVDITVRSALVAEGTAQQNRPGSMEPHQSSGDVLRILPWGQVSFGRNRSRNRRRREGARDIAPFCFIPLFLRGDDGVSHDAVSVARFFASSWRCMSSVEWPPQIW